MTFNPTTPLLLLVAAAYFLPWIVAMWREHPQVVPIFLLNLLLGWTLLGWVGVLIWAAMAFKPERTS